MKGFEGTGSAKLVTGRAKHKADCVDSWPIIQHNTILLIFKLIIKGQ